MIRLSFFDVIPSSPWILLPSLFGGPEVLGFDGRAWVVVRRRPGRVGACVPSATCSFKHWFS